jgi:transposase
VLDIASGNVITEFRLNHASAQFIKFLNKINREVPAELDVHVVLDDLSTHKTRAVHKWRLRHKRFHFHFTPTYGSWINLVERWFPALTTKKLQRSAHGPVNALAADIRDWVDIWNKDPTPFVWHKTADEILERFGRYLAATWPLLGRRHQDRLCRPISLTRSTSRPAVPSVPNPVVGWVQVAEGVGAE